MFKKELILTLLTFIGSHCCGAALPTAQAPITRGSFVVKNYSGQNLAISIYDDRGEEEGAVPVEEEIIDVAIDHGDDKTFNLPIGEYTLDLASRNDEEEIVEFEDPITFDITVPGAFTVYPDTISSSPPTSPVYSDPELSDSDTENT